MTFVWPVSQSLAGDKSTDQPDLAYPRASRRILVVDDNIDVRAHHHIVARLRVMD